MRLRTITLALVFGASLLLFGCASEHWMRTMGDAPVGTAHPVDAQLPGFNNIFQDGPFYFAGQPEPEGLERIAQRGVVTVVNIRPEAAMREKVNFDEAALVADLGMDYAHLPTSHATYAQDAELLGEIFTQTRGPVLIHCSSSNNAGALWAAYLIRARGFDTETALERGRAAGLTADETIEAVRAIPERGS